MSDWYDREYDRLVDAVNAGEISEQEFREETRRLADDLRAAAEQAAASAFDDVMGRW